jgi:hypothetical protein
MGNNTRKDNTIKAAWIGGCFVFAAAVVGALITIHGQKANASTSIVLNHDSGTIKAAGQDYMEAGRDVIKATGPVSISNVYGDTSKKKEKPNVIEEGSKGGDGSINITTYGQHGGANIGKLIVIKNATFVQSSEAPTAGASLSDNYSCVVDTFHKVITVHPKSGTWDTPFISFPREELDVVTPHFFNAAKTMINVDTATYAINGQSQFGLSSSTKPATATLSYSIHYETIPSKLVFGNYPNALYEVSLK